MCCCGRPTINGQLGAYSWDGKSFMTLAPAPPAIEDGDELLYDEAGRCGRLDCHSHHFRLVKRQYGGHALLVRHGGGDQRMNLDCVAALTIPSLAAMDSNTRYWFLHAFYSIHTEAERTARDSRDSMWRQAAAEKRIKTRKYRGSNRVRVTIEPPTPNPSLPVCSYVS